MKHIFSIITIGCTVLIGACGGGGGGGTPAPTVPVAAALSFPLKTAFSSTVANGSTRQLTVSGSCNGTANLTSAAAVGGATFEGISGRLSAARTLTISLTNCTPASIASTQTIYYDSNYTPLGTNTVGGEYGVFLTAPNIPTSAKVGDTGTIGTMTRYTNSTKTVLAGQSVSSYVVEADTASTAILNSISKLYNASNVLIATEQDRYRISTTGTPTLVSIDIQYANGSTTHLVLQ